ncbi:hypothetical protein [Halapricum salinum]|uniref:hypothetical protein n=1 Tax=Halapricum salinum TaxID=1457250 RepID=UPI0012ABC9F4|nr:hypothetical protein [Halapricum salinum]
MTDCDADEQMTVREFEAELTALLNRAVDGDVDVEGGWDIDVDGRFDLGVEITAVDRSE